MGDEENQVEQTTATNPEVEEQSTGNTDADTNQNEENLDNLPRQNSEPGDGNEDQTGEEQKEEEQEPSEEDGQESGKETRSPRLEKRFKKMGEKIHNKQQEISQLEQQLAQYQQSANQGNVQQGNTPQLEPGKEYSVDELQAIIDQQSSAKAKEAARQEIARYQEAQKQENFLNRWENDVGKITSKYPELDEESDSYDSTLSSVVAESLEEHMFNSVNPNAVEFVDRLMKGIRHSSKVEAGRVGESVAKQAQSQSVSARSAASKQSQKVDSDWIRNEYDPSNPEHRKLAQQYIAEKQS